MKIVSVLRPTSGTDEFPLFRILLEKDPALINIDDRNYGFFEGDSVFSSAVRRVNRRTAIRLFNDDISRYLEYSRPDWLIIFKGAHLKGRTIEFARKIGVRTVLIYPDLDPRVHGDEYMQAVQSVEFFYTTKKNLTEQFRHIRPDARFVTPLYSKRDIMKIQPAQTALGILFVGNYSSGKCRDLIQFANSLGKRVTLIGSGWRACRGVSEAKNIWQIGALYGECVRALYKTAVGNLGLLRESLGGEWLGDHVTSRSVLVPVAGGALLHPRNKESVELYGEDCELLYSGIDEAAYISEKLYCDSKWRYSVQMRQQDAVLERASSWEGLVRDWIS